ncbi:hypothetical protein [Parerythrobacter aestuarii]|uniref:hypothetical protein n=1 Tax=Parerythrobacter aestuarii TaxID=3020909 RepID=UPI0024DE2BDF|nr:hypothetical protein [Parerythrobacter aestuarii]
MRIEIALRERTEHVTVERADGSTAVFVISRKGPLPHDAYHFFVEQAFGIDDGFWGRVAQGEDPEAIQLAAIAGGHASAKRATEPDPALIGLIQAERLVECFEAESWSGSADDGAIAAMARAGWQASHVPPLELSAAALARVRTGLRELADKWREGAVKLTWEEEHHG